jgi:hypothetical protein
MPDEDRSVEERRAELVEILAGGVLRVLEKQATARAAGEAAPTEPAGAAPPEKPQPRMTITDQEIVSRSPLVIHAKFVLQRKGRRRRQRPPEAETPPEPTSAKRFAEVAQVARRLAEAHAFQRLLDDGKAKTQAELARQAGLTRARVTQIMNLLLLAPDLQEQVLMMKPDARGRDPVSERQLRHVVAAPLWEEQRRRWASILRGETRRAEPAKAPRVRILFSGDAAVFAGERAWDPSQRIKPVKRGAMFTMDASWTPAFVRWVVGFGAGAEVLSPTGLRECVAGELQRAAAVYAGRPSSRLVPATANVPRDGSAGSGGTAVDIERRIEERVEVKGR